MIFISTQFFSFGQNKELFTIEWLKPKVYSQGEKQIKVPNIKGQSLDGKRPNYYWINEVHSSANYDLSLVVTSTQPALSGEVKFLKDYRIEVGELDYELTVSNANTQKFIVLNLFPFVRKQGEIHRITSFKINYDKGKPQPSLYQKGFAANSVLQNGSGYWYKIFLNRAGSPFQHLIHRISIFMVTVMEDYLKLILYIERMTLPRMLFL